MTMTLRVLLIICSIISFLLCIMKIKQAKLKVENSVTWMIGSFVLIFMSVFSNIIEWISIQLGFMAPVNFVFLIIIGFLLIQLFIDNLRISNLNEKIKDLNHYIALKEYENNNKNGDKNEKI